MIVKCIGNKGIHLSRQTLANGGNTLSTDFGLIIGSLFIVYGIFISDNEINYLISEDNALPFWYPAELFEIVDNLFLIEWYFNFWGYDCFISAIWGYKELMNQDHYIDLIEREHFAIEIFLKRKKEIDEYHDLAKYKK